MKKFIFSLLFGILLGIGSGANYLASDGRSPGIRRGGEFRKSEVGDNIIGDQKREEPLVKARAEAKADDRGLGALFAPRQKARRTRGEHKKIKPPREALGDFLDCNFRAADKRMIRRSAYNDSWF